MSVVVEIAPNHGESICAIRIAHPRVVANFPKLAVTVIVVEQIRKPGEPLRSACDWHAVVKAVAQPPGGWSSCADGIYVAGDMEIHASDAFEFAPRHSS